MRGANTSRYEVLFSLPAVQLDKALTEVPPNLPTAKYFPSIGWTAMHSNLDNQDRFSVYFKSSKYGSFNHSHADQNSFVIRSGGKRLAIDSGYYDWYGSPHWKNWYQQTRAHNAVTFDQGQGQKFNDKGAIGKIVHFEHHAGWDVAVGDASKAYDGTVKKAQRTLLYIKPNTLIVYDQMDADVSHSWEWNIHAMNRMKVHNSRGVEIENDGERLCVQMLEPQDVHFSQTDRFDAQPDFPNNNIPNQWHGRFTTVSKMKACSFLTIIQANCKDSFFKQRQLLSRQDGYQIQLNGKKIFIGTAGAEVTPN